MTVPEIMCDTHGPCGLITLNRPQSLNALTHGMVRAMTRALAQWAQDPRVTRVVIKAAGDRAFCAGGDIRLLHGQGLAGDHAAQLAFWHDEYQLNAIIKRYPKPFVALVNGIVMGGGVGVSVHAAHVVAGDNFAFAMPEVGIGFFPDVGATWFLPRLPGHVGTYLALTGARVRASDALALGLAQAFVPGSAMAALQAGLVAGADVAACIASHAAPVTAPVSDYRWIAACFAPENLADIINALEVAAGQGNAAAGQARQQISAKSPTSLAIARRQMRMGAGLSFEQAMQVEYRIVSRLCRGPDFYEGVRALVIDKDNQPRWRPAKLDALDCQQLAGFFAPLPDGDLELPDSAGSDGTRERPA